MPICKLQLLGPVGLVAGCGRAVPVGRKSQALLSCIAAYGPKGVPRAKVLALLWPQHDEEQARSALRQALHQLKRRLPESTAWLCGAGDRLMLDGAALAVDLWVFRAAVVGRSWLAAARAYGGELASGLSLGAEFDQWLASQRSAVQDAASLALDGLVEQPDAVDAHDAALELARRMQLDDPFNEACYRALMVLESRAGQHGKAAEAWARCRRVLREELGADPSERTRQVYESLRVPRAVGAPRTGDGQARTDTQRRAFDHLLRGMQLFDVYDAASNARARVEFEAALACQPESPEALGMLGWTHFGDFLAGWTLDPEVSFDAALSACRRALATGTGRPLPHALHGKLLLWQRQHDEALVALHRCLTTSPADAYTHFHFADACMWSGLYADALSHIERALALEANDHGIFLAIQGMALYCSGDATAARPVLQSAFTRNPSYSWPYGTLAAVEAEQGNPSNARAAASTARRLNRRMSVSLARNVLPLRDAAARERLVAAWQSAGMPDDEANRDARG